MIPADDSTTQENRAETVGAVGHHGFGRWLYDVLWVLCRTLAISLFGFRVRFAEPLPPRGGLLVLSSHQSHLDPLLLGLATDRRLSSLARSSLYRFRIHLDSQRASGVLLSQVTVVGVNIILFRRGMCGHHQIGRAHV